MTHAVSVIIPTHGRPEKLAHCLAALSRQAVPAGVTFEVLVAVDGGAESGGVPECPAPPGTRFLPLPRCGISAARNAAIEAACGDLLLITNDDCYAAPDWIAAHLRAQSLRGAPGLVVGRAAWRAWDEPTVFDGLIRDTSMVFFFDRMTAGRTYGFRHGWGCNVAVPASIARELGGFDERLRPYGYEDLEFAYRVEQAGHGGVFYHPAAAMVHDHRIGWEDYLRRETCLGRTAACLAEVNPACFEAVFGWRDAAEMKAAFESWLQFDAGDHESAENLMREWAGRPLAEVADWPATRELLYGLHLPVKRRCFRTGFVEGFELRDDARWRERLVLGHSFP